MWFMSWWCRCLLEVLFGGFGCGVYCYCSVMLCFGFVVYFDCWIGSGLVWCFVGFSAILF